MAAITRGASRISAASRGGTSHPMTRRSAAPKRLLPALSACDTRDFSFISGTLLFPMIRRLTEYSAVIVRIPASSRLTLNFIASSPVTTPATAPASAPQSVAITGDHPATSSTADTPAPKVIEPSAVMSGNSKIRKLMYTPNANNDRMNPIVIAPMTKLI
jgi:hypothetical protein